MYREKALSTVSGWLMFPVLLAGLVASIWWLVVQAGAEASPPKVVLAIVAVTLICILFAGFFVVQPNDARVLTLFGKYSGSVKTDGFHWANPLLSKRRLSLRVRNFESSKIKVNDHEGNPIEIAAVVVWRVVETAEASFEVDNYEHYVKVQTESAVRNLATQYPYDAYIDGHKSLRANTAEIAEQLKSRDPGAAGQGGRRGDRGADQSPGLRAGDRRGDAAAAAGRRDHRRASAHRRGRGRHGRDGARSAVAARRSSSSTTSARRPWSATCSWCCAATATRSRSSTPGRSISNGACAAGAMPARPRPSWRNVNRFCSASIATCSTPCSVGPTTICAA